MSTKESNLIYGSTLFGAGYVIAAGVLAPYVYMNTKDKTMKSDNLK